MSASSSHISLELLSVPENLTLVRGMLAGIGDSLGMDPELLDDLKTAVSEAANNVVMHAYADDAGPLELNLTVSIEHIVATVGDHGVGLPEVALVGEHVQGVGIPVIEALTAEASFSTPPGGGTEVRMVFPAVRDGRPLFSVPAAPAPVDGWTDALSGDAVISISPVNLLPAVLGRLARALAATARFSLDRFSDVYLVTDALAVHASRVASTDRLGFTLQASPRALTIDIGPLRSGSNEQLHAAAGESPLVLLTDSLAASPAPGGQMLEVVMVDHRR